MCNLPAYARPAAFHAITCLERWCNDLTFNLLYILVARHRFVWCRFGFLATLDEDEEEEDAGSVASLALTDEDFSGPSIEEIDAAVREVSPRLLHARTQ